MGDDAWQSDDDDQVSVPMQAMTFTSRGRRGGRGGFRNNQDSLGSWRERSGDSNRESRVNGAWRGRDGDSNQQPRGEGGWRRSNFDEPREGEEEVVISVRSSDVGKLIGSGGSQIKELQQSSRARITVVKTNSRVPCPDTDVKISGSSEAISKAKSLIDELLNIDQQTRADMDHSKAEISKIVSFNDSGSDLPQIDWDAAYSMDRKGKEELMKKLPKLEKDFYHEHPNVSKMTTQDRESFWEENDIQVTFAFPDDPAEKPPIPNPVKTFQEAFWKYPDILTVIQSQGFETPTPIQCQSWPILMKGYDMISLAETGSGKTLAFLLPAFIHIEGQPSRATQEDNNPRALVIAPTRELAIQIMKESEKYKYHNLTCLCLYGGTERRKQVQELKGRIDIVMGTPGRLYDLVLSGALDLQYVSYVVLDEADRMLDMGFEPQIQKLLLRVRPDRQTVMTSATWNYTAKNLGKKYAVNPMQVIIGSIEHTTVHSVSQEVIILEDEEKWTYLQDVLTKLDDNDKVILFVNRKTTADYIASELVVSCQMEVTCLHGDRDQEEREAALEDLRNGMARILITTDVAARGIDIQDITLIINYDFPLHIEDYVHRVGRTGRAGKTGHAISFFTYKDRQQAEELIRMLEEANQEVPEGIHRLLAKAKADRERKDGFGRGGRGGGGRRGGGFRGGGGGGGSRSNRW